jgi:hypothetical protein
LRGAFGSGVGVGTGQAADRHQQHALAVVGESRHESATTRFWHAEVLAEINSVALASPTFQYTRYSETGGR